MESPIIRFEPYEYHPARRTLYRDGLQVHLRPQLIEILDYLLRHRDRSVARTELSIVLWDCATSRERMLATAISDLRGALEDDPWEPRLIETVRGYGFRFVGRVCAE